MSSIPQRWKKVIEEERKNTECNKLIFGLHYVASYETDLNLLNITCKQCYKLSLERMYKEPIHIRRWCEELH